MIKVACVDYRQWYSPFLIKSINKIEPKIKFYIYLPKSKSEKSFARQKYFSKSASQVWSSYTFPFEIFKKAISDRINILHIQWELNEFGSFYLSALLPLLLLFLRLANIKCVTTVHSVIPRHFLTQKLPGFTIPHGTKYLFEAALILIYRLVLFLSDAVIVHGKSLKKILQIDYKSSPEKISVIHYGISLEPYLLHSSNRFKSFLPQNSEIVLALGAVSPRKGLDTLIKAFCLLSSKHPAWILVIAGHVPQYYKHYYKQLTNLAPDLIKQKRIIFLGEFDLKDTNELMQKSKIVVFPYIYNFGASSTLTYALQHQKVVVISDLNFAKDILTNRKNALLIQPNSPDLLVEAIECAMIDSNLRNELNKGVATLLKRNSWDFAANETLKVYSKFFN